MEAEGTMGRHEVIRRGLFNIGVCSAGTEKEARDWVHAASPAGTSGNWMSVDPAKENLRPVACADHEERTHYVFCC